MFASHEFVIFILLRDTTRFMKNIQWGRTPTKLAKTNYNSVHKKEIIKDRENYRGVSLLDSGYKVCTSIIKNKSYTYYRNKLGEEQNGS
jgi:3'-phosphoadenosine 5'-phosphosulfate (PAPS) 3'-phosphatase